jgi:hypothetical protein
MATLAEKQSELDKIKERLASSNDLYAQYVGGAATVGDQIKKGLNDKFGAAGEALIKDENRLQEELTTTPTNYAADMETKGRFASNPILAGQAAAQRSANIERRLQDIRGIRQNREGTLNEIINSGTNAFKAQTAVVGAQRDAVKDEYNIGQGEYDRIFKETTDARDFKERQRQFNVSEANQNARAAASRTASGLTMKEAMDQMAKLAEVEKKYQIIKNKGGGVDVAYDGRPSNLYNFLKDTGNVETFAGILRESQDKADQVFFQAQLPLQQQLEAGKIDFQNYLNGIQSFAPSGFNATPTVENITDFSRIFKK